MSKTPDTQMPPLSPNCETCPVFDRCSAVAGMKAVATLVTIVNNDESLRPWAERTLEALGEDTNNVSGAIASCGGAMEVTHPGAVVKVSGYSFAPPGSKVSRRSVVELDDPNAADTVKLRVPARGSLIKDIETAASFEDNPGQLAYALTYPDRVSTQSPFGSIIQGERYKPSFMDEDGVATREAARRICNSFIAFDRASTVLNPEELERMATTMRKDREEEERRRRENYN